MGSLKYSHFQVWTFDGSFDVVGKDIVNKAVFQQYLSAYFTYYYYGFHIIISIISILKINNTSNITLNKSSKYIVVVVEISTTIFTGNLLQILRNINTFTRRCLY